MADKVNKEKASQFINSKWLGDKRCPICMQAAWALSDIVVEIQEFNREGLVLGGPKVPLVPVTCTACGYTHFFNAILIGVIEPPKKPESEPQATPPPPNTAI